MIYIVVLIFVLGVLALTFLIRKSNDLSPFEGKASMVAFRYFRCKEHNYQRLVSLYDHDDPPTCPICGKNLVKGDE